MIVFKAAELSKIYFGWSEINWDWNILNKFLGLNGIPLFFQYIIELFSKFIYYLISFWLKNVEYFAFLLKFISIKYST